MTAGIFLDGIIAFLLIVTIIYCWRLSRKIALLHEGKEDLNKFIQEFNQAVMRAESNIDELKELGEKNDEQLNDHIQKARFLANDLSFLMEKGEDVAGKLELYITSSKIMNKSGMGENKQISATANSRPNLKNPEPKIHQPAGFTRASAEKPLPLTNPIQAKKPVSEKIKKKMALSKKQALDEVLGQIAVRKKKSTPVMVSENRDINDASEQKKDPIERPKFKLTRPEINSSSIKEVIDI